MRLRPVRAAIGALVAGILTLTACQPAASTVGRVAAPAARTPAAAPANASSPGAPGPASTPAAIPRPRRYYLALGDSLAFGYQQARLDAEQAAGDYDPATFRGYNAGLARRLAEAERATVTTVNLACPGETTTTFRNGGCPFRARLHVTYAGPQQAAAARFLAAHRGATPLVTLSLGANDLIALEAGCGFRLTCLDARLPSVTETVATRVAAAVRRLHAADPHARVVVLAPYNPLGSLLPATNPRLQGFDAALAAAVRPGRWSGSRRVPRVQRRRPAAGHALPAQRVLRTWAGRPPHGRRVWRAGPVAVERGGHRPVTDRERSGRRRRWPSC